MPKRERRLDPEAERWYQKYPTFPGVQKCVELLRNRNLRGARLDFVCILLEEQATNCVEELLQAFHAESDSWVKFLILNAIAAAESPRVVPFLAECLGSSDPELRHRAAAELERIDTKQARTALFRDRQNRQPKYR